MTYHIKYFFFYRQGWTYFKYRLLKIDLNQIDKSSR